MRSNLKIGLYNPVSLTYQGGGERWILEVAGRLLARGHDVTVFTTLWNPSFSKGAKLFHSGVARVVELRYLRFFRGFAFPSPLDLNVLIKKFNDLDMVYFYVYPPNELMAWTLKHQIRSPLIGGFHTFLAPTRFLLHSVYKPIFRRALRVFRGLHVLNSSTAYLMKEWGYRNVYFIPNGVDTNVFRLGDFSCRDKFNVLYTGRLTEDKGADVLLGIVRYVNEELGLRNIRFTICGFGPFRRFVEEVARKYENVDYLGFVPSETFPQIYANADLFLIPSKSEGMPLRLLEAQSCGLPAVGSKIPGISDVVINGKTGCLVNVGDIKSFAETIKKYYELWRGSPKEYYKINKAIREHIVKNYDWNIIINELEEMIRECA